MTVSTKNYTYVKLNCLKLSKTVCKKMSDLFKNVIYKMCLEIMYLIYV